MLTVSIEAINHQSFDQIVRLEVHETMLMAQIYQAYKSMLIDQLDAQCDFNFEQVVLYQKINPTRKLPANLKFSEISTNNLELAIIFPADNRPIIEYQFADKEYFITDYTKFDNLSVILNKIKGPMAVVIQQQKFDRIVINGVDIDYSKEKGEQFKKYMEGHINANIRIQIYSQFKAEPEKPKDKNQVDLDAIQIQAFDRAKEKIPVNVNPPSPSKKPVEVAKNEAVKNEERWEEMKVERKAPQIQIKKVEVKEQYLDQGKVLEKKVQVSKPQLKEEQPISPISPVKLPPKKPDQNTILLVIKFDIISGQGGRTEVSLDVDRSKSMQQLLPQIISSIKKNGFDWDFGEYDHARDRNKLNISQDSHQFKKLDKPLKTLVNNTQKQLLFTIERHYEGGWRRE